MCCRDRQHPAGGCIGEDPHAVSHQPHRVLELKNAREGRCHQLSDAVAKQRGWLDSPALHQPAKRVAHRVQKWLRAGDIIELLRRGGEQPVGADLRAFSSERISQKSLVALRAEIVAEMTIGRLDLIWIFVYPMIYLL